MYTKNIGFHVGKLSDWIDNQFLERGGESLNKTFLSHIILDMPSGHHHVKKAASALHVNGSLLVFIPSITHFVAIVEVIKQSFLPLQLDRVVEQGHDMTGEFLLMYALCLAS